MRSHALSDESLFREVDEEVRFESKFPVTATNDWCGDYTPHS